MQFDIQSLAIILGVVGGGGLLGLLGKVYTLRKTIDDKQDAKACDTCRKEIDARLQTLRDELHTRANKAEVDAHGVALSEQAKSLAVLQAQLSALTESMRRVEQMVERLVERG